MCLLVVLYRVVDDAPILVAANREAWDRQVAKGDMWTVPVGPERIEAARRGEWSVVLIGQTQTRAWLPDTIEGRDVLCLASGGGQQGPILAAGGARVTVFDNSPAQLARDRETAARYDLELRTVEGDMVDLGAFTDESFDLIVHPVSNVFSSQVRPVWREAFRVLRPGGLLLAGFMNPTNFMFDWAHADRTGELKVCYALPYADERDLPAEELAQIKAEGIPLEFSHSLEDQIGGQLDAGFVLTALCEAHRGADERPNPLTPYMPAYIATRALKPE